MRVLVVGGGGREHALCWSIVRSPRAEKVYCAPGNAGIAELVETVDIGAGDVDALVRFAVDARIDLTVVGPEEPLVNGLVDRLQAAGLRAFGPTAAAAELEGSKAFAKELMNKHVIPSAGFRIFDDVELARKYLRAHDSYPLVIKADGLAAGKGVVICRDADQARAALETIMVERRFGTAGNRVVIEDFLVGEEASIMAITDGRVILPLPSSQDHKALGDGDQGPNTGGMGAYSPAPVITPRIMQQIEATILVPTIHAMHREGRRFTGVLYCGLMITPGGPRVLEYNVRFGDPEAQAVLPRLRGDWLTILDRAATHQLGRVEFDWDPRPALCVVMASKGYPGKPVTGVPIHGLTGDREESLVFHGGTGRREGELVTTGGRVLGVTALGSDLPDARVRAYRRVEEIRFEGAHYRSDIGLKALKHLGKA
ncbi:MAG: phosphoribosylamine--glycine ligase [Planctomycetes bacterium]|nr:phosphoribosylamine--glycine ligase [Planctomycetota bacterium]